MFRVNVITHSKQFKNQRTKPLRINPHKSAPSTQKSRISVPFWEHKRHLKNKVKGTWRFSRKERNEIKKSNRAYLNKKKKNSTRK